LTGEKVFEAAKRKGEGGGRVGYSLKERDMRREEMGFDTCKV
jgi:phage FluMu gp28-like protein